MKKILLVLVTIFTLAIGINNVQASDKVKVYFFRGKTCEHCESALNYMDKHRDQINSNVEIVTLEVWENESNSKLQDAVADRLEVDRTKNYGVPFIVIGDKYIKGYADASTFREIMQIAEDYIDNEEYKDVVEEVRREKNLKVVSYGLDDLFSKPNKTVTIIVYSIFGIAIIGIIALIMFGRHN